MHHTNKQKNTYFNILETFCLLVIYIYNPPIPTTFENSMFYENKAYFMKLFQWVGLNMQDQLNLLQNSAHSES